MAARALAATQMATLPLARTVEATAFAKTVLPQPADDSTATTFDVLSDAINDMTIS
jgi:hypothetical protein